MSLKKMAFASSAFFALRAQEYSKSMQRIAIMRNCSSVGGEKCDTASGARCVKEHTWPAQASLNLLTAARNQQWHAA